MVVGLTCTSVLIGSNIVAARLLRAAPSTNRFDWVQGLTTGAEWLVVGSLLLQYVDVPGSRTPVLLGLPVLTTGLRYGRAGLVAGAVCAAVGVTSLLSVQALVLDLVDPGRAVRVLAGWLLLFVAMAIVVGATLKAIAASQEWERERLTRAVSGQRRLQHGLSEREWALLPLLVQDELTYEQIGKLLCISRETVKTHVRHLSAKLDAKGRRGVVAAARDRQLL